MILQKRTGIVVERGLYLGIHLDLLPAGGLKSKKKDYMDDLKSWLAEHLSTKNGPTISVLTDIRRMLSPLWVHRKN